MAPDVRFVVDAPQAHPAVSPAQGPGDALADAGLARARRADEEQDGAGLLLFQVHHGDLLDDPFLHLFEAVVVLVQDAPGGGQVDGVGLLLFPAQAGHEVQPVVEHAGFHALPPLLLQAVQHLLRLPAGGLVHAGFFDLPLEFLHVGHVFRVHFVQLLLQAVDLPLDGGLLVALLALLLLGGDGLVGDAPHLQEFIEGLFHQLGPFGLAVLRQDGVTLLVPHVQPGGHDAGGHADGADLAQDALRRRGPLKALGIVPHLLHQVFQLFRLHRAVQVLRVGAAGDGELHRPVRVDAHGLEVHPVLGVHHGEAPVQLRHGAGDADGVEAVLRHVRQGHVFLRHDEDELFTHGDLPVPGAAAQHVQGQIKSGLRAQYHVIGRYDDHGDPSFGIE